MDLQRKEAHRTGRCMNCPDVKNIGGGSPVCLDCAIDQEISRLKSRRRTGKKVKKKHA